MRRDCGAFVSRTCAITTLVVGFSQLVLANPVSVDDLTEVVLFSGGVNPANNNTYYYTDMVRAWDITSALFGADNVYVLWAGGVNDMGIGVADQSDGSSSDWSFVPAGHILSATQPNLQTTIEDVVPEAAGGNPYSFLFYAFDHGEPQNDDSTTDVMLDGWMGSNITNQQLATYAGSLTAEAELYDFNECYSKGMTQPLLANSSGNVFAMYASTFCSFGNGFSNAFLDAIDPNVAGLTSTVAIGQYAVQNDPFGQNGTKDEDPGFAGYNFSIMNNTPVPEPSYLFPTLGLFLGVVKYVKRSSSVVSRK